MSSTPETVEPGQVWRDKDERSKGAGEFTVEEIVPTAWGPYVLGRREATGRLTRIRLSRLLKGPYTYIGRQR